MDETRDFKTVQKKYYSFALAMYQKYQELCRKYCIQEKSFRRIESLQPYVRTNMAPKWEADYFHELAELGNSGTMDFFQQKEDLLTGQIMQAARAMCKAVREIDHAKRIFTGACKSVSGYQSNGFITALF